ncbi:MAG TPA: RNA polymerase sigma factor [Terriglobia bacterium]|nr:RNA polymerase sigma factor [Terriglobia bacterium]
MDLSQIATFRMAADTPESSGARATFARILERARAGDRTAFDSIVILYRRRVLMTAWRLLGRLEDAEDAAQEVFLRLFRCLNLFDGKRDLAPWLYRITINVCHDARRRRERTSSLPIHELSPPNARVALPAQLDEDLLKTEQKRILELSLAALTEKERTAVVLRDIEGLSTKEVARILGSSETTVRSQVSVARVKIKKFIDRQGFTSEAGSKKGRAR